MNQIQANFGQILNFAQNYGLPASKQRAILREFLQVKIIDFLYREKVSVELLFAGGTSLRLLRGLDRFSEDLDFDTKLKDAEVKKLVHTVYTRLKRENLELDLYENKTRERNYYEFRFKNLLSELKISVNEEEKLTIKFDYERFWKGQKKEVILINKYGVLANIMTIPLDQLLTQKLYAYIHRKQTLPRDLYDIIWLIAQGARFDLDFTHKNKLPADLVGQALAKFKAEQHQLSSLKLKLRPFLFEGKQADKLDFFSGAVTTLLITP